MSAAGTLLITGASRGLGLGLTRATVARGWTVFAGCRDRRRASELERFAAAAGGRVRVVELDVGSDASVATALAEIATATARLDVLVNNAGCNPPPRELGVAAVPVSLVRDVVDVNLLGCLRALQAALPLLRRSPNARVVNISSGAGSLTRNPARTPQPAYCLSKAALNMLTRLAARELGDITVVSVSPGWIRTDMGGPDGELSVEEAAGALAIGIEQLAPAQSGQWLDRFGRPSDYAW